MNQGLTLDQYLQRKSPLEPAQAARIALQLAQQIGQAAESQIVHPGRILVQKDGTVKLLPPAAEDLALPAIVEYPAYASPEEIHGGKPDVRSALYSLGCTLYELLSGAPPYAASDPRKLLHMHLESPIPDVRQKASGVSDGLAEVVRELLEKDPELRIQSPQELGRRLRQSLPGAGSPPAGAAPAPAYGTRPRTSQTPQAAPSPAAARPAAPAARTPAIHGLPASHSASRRQQPGAAAVRRGHADARGPSRRHAGHHPAHAAHARGAQRGPEDEEEPVEEYAPPPKKSFAVTVAGGVVGLLLGFLAWRSVVGSVDERRADLVRRVSEHKVKKLAARKKDFVDRNEQVKKPVTDALAKIKVMPLEKRQKELVQRLEGMCTNPAAHQFLGELARVWKPEALQEAGDVAAVDKAYEAQVAEAEKLHREGKLGDAIEKLNENQLEFNARHGKERDAKIKEWSDAIEAKWKADEARAQSLSRDKPDEAIAILRNVMGWGDQTARGEADKMIESIQAQLVLQAGAGKPKESPEPDGDEPKAEAGNPGAEIKDPDGDGAAEDKKKAEAGEKKETPDDFEDPDAK